MYEQPRSSLSREDIPEYDLNEAILVVTAMLQDDGGHPSTPRCHMGSDLESCMVQDYRFSFAIRRSQSALRIPTPY